VYRPELETVPLVAVQVTAVLLVPLTVAVNCCVVPACIDVDVGLIDTATGAVTVMVDDADFELSATLVAVMV
jgi:hypothetical protein